MAYQNGTATNPNDLLQKMVAFLVACGWTQDSSVADGTGWRAHLHRGPVYVNFRATNTEGVAACFDNGFSAAGFIGISMYVGSGYSAGSSWKAQAGGPRQVNAPTSAQGVSMRLAAGAISGYDFFSNGGGADIVFVVEKSAGLFAHLGFGVSIEKSCAFTGGEYFFGSQNGYVTAYPSSFPGYTTNTTAPMSLGGGGTGNAVAGGFVRADVDSFVNKWVGIGTDTSSYPPAYTGRIGYSSIPFYDPQDRLPSFVLHAGRATNALNGQSMLLPGILAVERDSAGASIIGTLPHIFTCSACAFGMAPRGVYLWGTKQYMVYPGPVAVPYSGFAIRKED